MSHRPAGGIGRAVLSVALGLAAASPATAEELRLEAGTIQVQAHDPATDYEVLWLRATELKR